MENFEQQFRDAFERYSDELFRHCSMRIADRERALELTQEVFLRSWEYVQKGNEIRDLRPFFYRTLKNLIIDEYRKAKTYSLDAMVEGDQTADIEQLMPTDDTNTLEAAMERFDGKHAVAQLSKLPDLYREVLLLRYVESLSPKEIAQALDESENTISVRIHRGLQKLKELLQNEQ